MSSKGRNLRVRPMRGAMPEQSMTLEAVVTRLVTNYIAYVVGQPVEGYPDGRTYVLRLSTVQAPEDEVRRLAVGDTVVIELSPLDPELVIQAYLVGVKAKGRRPSGRGHRAIEV